MDGVVDIMTEMMGMMDNATLSPTLKDRVEELYKMVLGKTLIRTSCNDCYRDAIIEMYTYLKRNGKMKEQSAYKLKRGCLLQPTFASSEMYTNDNLTDEVAESYLADNPDKIVWFEEYPEDWSDRCSARKDGKANTIVQEMIAMFDNGKTEEEIKEAYRGKVVDGKRLRNRTIASYVREAKRNID